MNSPSPEYIVGYELHLNVKQYSENGQYWRGVDSCYAITTTRNTSLAIGEMFHERFVMHRSNEPRPLDLTGALVVGFGTIFVIFIALYFCRRQTCVVCQERLILFFDRCWLCRLFGGFIPDPELLKVLETKGEYLQNESERPERFPGSRKLVACIRGLVSCCCSSKSAKVDPDTDVESGSVSEKSKGFCGCCCSRKKKQKKKTARELKVVPLTVEPFVYYEAVHHPNIPLEILERKQKIEADHLYKEDLDIYGDLEHVPVKEGTDAHAAKLRIIAYREAKRKQHEKDAEKEKEKAFAELAKSKLISPQKRGVSEKSAAITSLARSKSSNALITDTRRNLGTNRKAKVVSEEKGTSDPLLLKPQQSFWTKATSKMGLGTSSQPLPDASLMTSGGVSTRGLGDIDVEETTTPQNNWKSALSGKFDAVATGVVNFSFPNRPKTPVEVEASKYAYLHKNEEHPET